MERTVAPKDLYTMQLYEWLERGMKVRTAKPGEQRPSPAQEARQLIEAFQQLLDQLLSAQEAIEVDQERMAWGLLQAKQAKPPDSELDTQVFIFLDGLELRIRDYEEGCYKLSLVERRLAQCLELMEANLELKAVQQAGLVDEVLAARLLEQRRVIQLQQEELDQLQFERQVLSEEAARLREELEVWEPGEMPQEEEFGVGFAQASSAEAGRPASPLSPGVPRTPRTPIGTPGRE
ncbi:unnamed protein product, partial [Effrenium voratum]